MKFISILIGKSIIKLSRLFGNHGSALPGLVIEKLNPKFLANTLTNLQEGVVVVTGTNGKTTTTKVLVRLLERQGMTVLSNPTGSNFTRGIVSSVLDRVSLTGKLDYDIAVLELDEAFSRIFVKSVKPRYVLLLNVMRDQLDRYGEIDTTAKMLSETAHAATLGVIINQADSRLLEIAQTVNTNVTYFGVSQSLQSLLPSDDDLHNKEAIVEHHNVNEVELESYDNQLAVYTIGDKQVEVDLQITGIHNALNVAGALASVRAMVPGINPDALVSIVEEIKPAWGRGEVCHVGDTRVILALVKNPAGMQQSLRSYQHDDNDMTMFAINDQFADGRDVSWLWDVDYTTIKDSTEIHCGGVRANDMATRLIYDDYKIKTIDSQESRLLQHLISNKPERILVYCTYTAMLNLRKYLAKVSDLPAEIWG